MDEIKFSLSINWTPENGLLQEQLRTLRRRLHAVRGLEVLITNASLLQQLDET